MPDGSVLPSNSPPSAMARSATWANVMEPPGPETRPLSTLYAFGDPPSALDATNRILRSASSAAAKFARV